MGMVLEIFAARDATIDALTRDPAQVWRLIDPDGDTMYDEARTREARRERGFFARLFGAPDAPVAPTPRIALDATETSVCDLDKAWHGIHFVLTQTADGGEPPLDFLVQGGESIGEDVGYGEPRAFRAADVIGIHAALAQLSDADLRARFNAADMKRKDIYPDIWDRTAPGDDVQAYLYDNLTTLRRAIAALAQQQLGMLVVLQ